MTLEKDEILSELSSGKFVLAISGGVDSVCLLDLVYKTFKDSKKRFIVAHVDHGIRDESDWDCRFVSELADKYGFQFKSTKLSLGKHASEAEAREHRYKYLKSLKFGPIATAQHQDDSIETMILNLTRGTNRRGLISIKSDQHIVRPLLKATKAELIDYAVKEHLEWLEDETNLSSRYRRNRLRQKLAVLANQELTFAKQLLAIQESLKEADTEIDELVVSITDWLAAANEPMKWERYKFIHLPPIVRREVIMQAFRMLVKDNLSQVNRQTIVKTEHFICTAKFSKHYTPIKGLRLSIDEKLVMFSKNL